MKTYIQFIKEENGNATSIQEIYNGLKEVFTNDDVFSTDSVYERIDNQLRLIISISKLFTKDQVIIYTKFIFNVDDKKSYLTSNTFKYLYEINCQYSNDIQFNDIQDFKTKIGDIINNNRFGQDLKILSEFIKKPEHTIDEWFYDNKIRNISVTGFKYEPDMKNIPCEKLDFTFEITINDQDKIELVLKKNGPNKFKYEFVIFDKRNVIEKPNIETLIQTIGETIRDSYRD